jgi:hypothetical protein
MPTGIFEAVLGAISGIFAAINNVFGAKNTKEMKDRQLNQKDINFESDIEAAIREKDVKKIRDTLAE